MISKIECVMLKCDNCKGIYESGGSIFTIFSDEESMLQNADDDGWETSRESGKHYCEDCHHYNDQDKFVLNTERTKQNK